VIADIFLDIISLLVGRLLGFASVHVSGCIGTMIYINLHHC